MEITSHSFTCGGPGKNNEDAVLAGLPIHDGYVFAIADGMGGKPGGEVAAREAISEIENILNSPSSVSMDQLFRRIKQKFAEISDEKPELSAMGTTLTVCEIQGAKATVGHVGDTRLYHLRGNGLVDRTRDQTEVQRLIDDGILSKARARGYPRRHILLSVLSPNREYELYESEFEVYSGDRLIFLTDGIYEKILRREVATISANSANCEELAQNLRERAEERGATDDYSAICAELS